VISFPEPVVNYHGLGLADRDGPRVGVRALSLAAEAVIRCADAMSDPDEDLNLAVCNVLQPLSRTRFAKLSPTEQAFVLIWNLEVDVNNGGFKQYFFNSDLDPNAVPHALRAVGADRAAAIVERALALFPNGAPPSECFARQKVLEGLDPDCDLFESLDQEFFAYPDDLSVLLAQFVRANRGSIRGS
jgi:hypothetical protein